MGRIRVLLVDDHAVLRAGLRMLINAQPDMEVAGEAASGEEGLRLARELQPDVVLMDITMPGAGGIDATAEIRRACPRVRVLALTMHDDPAYLRSVLAAGGSGYVLKRAADTELLSAIRITHRGETYLAPSLAGAVVQEVLGRKARGGRGEVPGDSLSEREREVLCLIAQGHTNQQVADRLCLSVKTVETYRARLMEKLGLKSRADLVRYALSTGLLSSR
ncbi:MAG: response regulator transcription factor [Candidatus Rokubacteria bacterium]|nr:response regulator transcription factor [Candidatus Rokubacteria bacterium]